MAADAYIRTAITQLQTASADLQQQISGLQQQVNNQKQQLQEDIKQMEQERGVHSAEVDSAGSEIQKHLAAERIHQINRQCDEKRAQMSQLDTDVANVIQRKTQAYNTLHNLSSQLDLLMASPDIR